MTSNASPRLTLCVLKVAIVLLLLAPAVAQWPSRNPTNAAASCHLAITRPLVAFDLVRQTS